MNDKEYLKFKEYCDLITQDFYGMNPFDGDNGCGYRSLIRLLNKNNIEYLLPNTELNSTLNTLFLKSTIEKVKDLLENSIGIININESKYNINKADISPEFLNKYYYTKAELKTLLGINNVTGKLAINDINAIRINIGKNEYMYRKEQIDEIVTIYKNTIKATDLLNEISKELGIQIKKERFLNYINKNYELEKKVPFFKNNTLIYRKDIDDIKKHFKFIIEQEKTVTAYDKYKIFLKNTPLKNDKIPNTLDLLDKYCLTKSNESNRYSDLYRDFVTIYKVLVSRLSVELITLKQDKVIDLLRYTQDNYGYTAKENLRIFYNFILTNCNSKENIITKSSKEDKEVEPYTIDVYFEVLYILMNKMNDRNFIETLLDNRALTSLLTYIFSHYTTVWRKKDIIRQIPYPNLKIIGFENGYDFIQWIKNKDNCFTVEMGKEICNDIEHKIETFRLTASKNDGDLVLFISEFMYGAYGLLLCICEAHRETVRDKNFKTERSDTLLSIGAIDSRNQKKYMPVIFGDRLPLLLPTSSFSNRRANKSFETYVSNKSEEWNMGIGYLMASILRGHKLNDNLISETTKIYINKNVDQVSLEAFCSGTLGGIKYKLLELLEDDFSTKPSIDKINAINALPITQYQIENIMKNLATQKAKVDKYLDIVLKKNTDGKKVLKELLYGKNSYAKHKHTKCLYRACENALEDSTMKIKTSQKKCINANSKGCIGCPFLVAKVYFLYELSDKLKEAVNTLKNSTNNIDILINLHRIVDLYMPVIYEACSEIGKEYVGNIIDIKEMIMIVNKHRGLLK